jgi:hypothetical protein
MHVGVVLLYKQHQNNYRDQTPLRSIFPYIISETSYPFETALQKARLVTPQSHACMGTWLPFSDPLYKRNKRLTQHRRMICVTIRYCSETVAITRYTQSRLFGHDSIVPIFMPSHLGHSVTINKYKLTSQDRSMLSPLPSTNQDPYLNPGRLLITHTIMLLQLHDTNFRKMLATGSHFLFIPLTFLNSSTSSLVGLFAAFS